MLYCDSLSIERVCLSSLEVGWHWACRRSCTAICTQLLAGDMGNRGTEFGRHTIRHDPTFAVDVLQSSRLHEAVRCCRHKCHQRSRKNKKDIKRLLPLPLNFWRKNLLLEHQRHTTGLDTQEAVPLSRCNSLQHHNRYTWSEYLINSPQFSWIFSSNHISGSSEWLSMNCAVPELELVFLPRDPLRRFDTPAGVAALMGRELGCELHRSDQLTVLMFQFQMSNLSQYMLCFFNLFPFTSRWSRLVHCRLWLMMADVTVL